MDRNKRLKSLGTLWEHSTYIFPDKLSEEIIVNVLGEKSFYEDVYLKNKEKINPDHAFAFSSNIFTKGNLYELYLIDSESYKDARAHNHIGNMELLISYEDLEKIDDIHRKNMPICDYDDDIRVG